MLLLYVTASTLETLAGATVTTGTAVGLGRVGARVGVRAFLAFSVGVAVRVVRSADVGGVVVVNLGVAATGGAVAITITVTTTVITRGTAVATAVGGGEVSVAAMLTIGRSVGTVGASVGDSVGAVVGKAVGGAIVVGADVAVAGSVSGVADSAGDGVKNRVTSMGRGVAVAPKGNAGVLQAASASTAHNPNATLRQIQV